MPTALTVTRQFGTHNKGDRITDPKQVEAIRQSSNHANVVAVTVPEQPVPPAPTSIPNA